jgi:hypothetical protein
VQHKAFATTLKGVQQQRTVGRHVQPGDRGQTIVDNMKLDLLVASGGVLSHAPEMAQTAMMLIDAFEPEGFTTLGKDSIFMMPHLGVLAQVHPQASLEVFERDCLVYLGTCVAAKGQGKAAEACFRSVSVRPPRNESRAKCWSATSGDCRSATERRPPFGSNQTRGSIGRRPGQAVEREVRGGSVG